MSGDSDRFVWKKGDVDVTPGPDRGNARPAARKGKSKGKGDSSKGRPSGGGKS